MVASQVLDIWEIPFPRNMCWDGWKKKDPLMANSVLPDREIEGPWTASWEICTEDLDSGHCMAFAILISLPWFLLMRGAWFTTKEIRDIAVTISKIYVTETNASHLLILFKIKHITICPYVRSQIQIKNPSEELYFVSHDQTFSWISMALCNDATLRVKEEPTTLGSGMTSYRHDSGWITLRFL